MRKYEYMVVYVHANGWGRSEVTRSKPIKSTIDIQNMEKVLKEKNQMDLLITDFKLLKTYTEKESE